MWKFQAIGLQEAYRSDNEACKQPRRSLRVITMDWNIKELKNRLAQNTGVTMKHVNNQEDHSG